MNIPYPPAKRPLPKHAKKVFTGEIFDVYQWEQEMYDGSTVIFEKIKRADTVSVIPITTEQKILISHEEQPGLKPFYGVFGGRIEPEENPLSAAKRELLEETGYQSDKWKLWLLKKSSGQSFLSWPKIVRIFKLKTSTMVKRLKLWKSILKNLLNTPSVQISETQKLVIWYCKPWLIRQKWLSLRKQFLTDQQTYLIVSQ